MRIHFIGIGGIGVSSLARWYTSEGHRVSGSDLTESKITRELCREGIPVRIGHKKAYLPKRVDLVIYSRAIPSHNPELMEARRRGVRLLSYPEAVGELTKRFTTIAVAGAHGKSTTTALTALVLMRGGLDPNVILGTELKELGGKNMRRGKGKHLILEADEWSASFLHYSPAIAMVTNIDREHLDFYKNLANIKKMFLKFLKKVPRGGVLILNRDNDNLRSLAPRIQKLAARRELLVRWCTARSPIARKIKGIIKIPGAHNVSNACAAYAVGETLGIPKKKILAAIGAYRGAWRRFEYRGNYQPPGTGHQLPVYDDYAHHPTEISATLAAFKEKFPRHRLICVFQAHQGRRLRLLFKEFVRAFDAADTAIITPMYKVPGRDEKINPRFSPEALARTMQKKYPRKPIFYLSDFKHLESALAILATTPQTCGTPKDSPPPTLKPAVIVMMGAGDISEYTSSLFAPP